MGLFWPSFRKQELSFEGNNWRQRAVNIVNLELKEEQRRQKMCRKDGTMGLTCCIIKR